MLSVAGRGKSMRAIHQEILDDPSSNEAAKKKARLILSKLGASRDAVASNKDTLSGALARSGTGLDTIVWVGGCSVHIGKENSKGEKNKYYKLRCKPVFPFFQHSGHTSFNIVDGHCGAYLPVANSRTGEHHLLHVGKTEFITLFKPPTVTSGLGLARGINVVRSGYGNNSVREYCDVKLTNISPIPEGLNISQLHQLFSYFYGGDVMRLRAIESDLFPKMEDVNEQVKIRREKALSYAIEKNLPIEKLPAVDDDIKSKEQEASTAYLIRETFPKEHPMYKYVCERAGIILPLSQTIVTPYNYKGDSNIIVDSFGTTWLTDVAHPIPDDAKNKNILNHKIWARIAHTLTVMEVIGDNEDDPEEEPSSVDTLLGIEMTIFQSAIVDAFGMLNPVHLKALSHHFQKANATVVGTLNVANTRTMVVNHKETKIDGKHIDGLALNVHELHTDVLEWLRVGSGVEVTPEFAINRIRQHIADNGHENSMDNTASCNTAFSSTPDDTYLGEIFSKNTFSKTHSGQVTNCMENNTSIFMHNGKKEFTKDYRYFMLTNAVIPEDWIEAYMTAQSRFYGYDGSVYVDNKTGKLHVPKRTSEMHQLQWSMASKISQAMQLSLDGKTIPADLPQVKQAADGVTIIYAIKNILLDPHKYIANPRDFAKPADKLETPYSLQDMMNGNAARDIADKKLKAKQAREEKMKKDAARSTSQHEKMEPKKKARTQSSTPPMEEIPEAPIMKSLSKAKTEDEEQVDEKPMDTQDDDQVEEMDEEEEEEEDDEEEEEEEEEEAPALTVASAAAQAVKASSSKNNAMLQKMLLAKKMKAAKAKAEKEEAANAEKKKARKATSSSLTKRKKRAD